MSGRDDSILGTVGIGPLLEHFGVAQMPWVVRAYLTLLFICTALMIFAMVQASGFHGTGSPPASQVLTLTIDSFKTVLGAVIGSLSMAASFQFGGKHPRSTSANDAADGAA